MVYRPTVRYADIFKDYVDDIFHATTLDRNQIIRAALFTSICSKEFQSLIKQYKKKDVPLPSQYWSIEQHELWMEQNPVITKGGKDANVTNNIGEEKGVRCQKQKTRGKTEIQKNREGIQSETKEKASHSRTPERPIRKVHPNDQGGIVIRIG